MKEKTTNKYCYIIDSATWVAYFRPFLRRYCRQRSVDGGRRNRWCPGPNYGSCTGGAGRNWKLNGFPTFAFISTEFVEKNLNLSRKKLLPTAWKQMRYGTLLPSKCFFAFNWTWVFCFITGLPTLKSLSDIPLIYVSGTFLVHSSMAGINRLRIQTILIPRDLWIQIRIFTLWPCSESYSMFGNSVTVCQCCGTVPFWNGSGSVQVQTSNFPSNGPGSLYNLKKIFKLRFLLLRFLLRLWKQADINSHC